MEAQELTPFQQQDVAFHDALAEFERKKLHVDAALVDGVPPSEEHIEAFQRTRHDLMQALEGFEAVVPGGAVLSH